MGKKETWARRVDGGCRPRVVRKVGKRGGRRVNYEEWRGREREKGWYIRSIGRCQSLVIKGPFCYRFNRIIPSRTDRKFGGMATRVGPSVLLKFHAACVSTHPSTHRPPTTPRHSPSAAHRPPQTIFTRGHHLAACEIHLGKCSRYIANSRSFRS